MQGRAALLGALAQRLVRHQAGAIAAAAAPAPPSLASSARFASVAAASAVAVAAAAPPRSHSHLAVAAALEHARALAFAAGEAANNDIGGPDRRSRHRHQEATAAALERARALAGGAHGGASAARAGAAAGASAEDDDGGGSSGSDADGDAAGGGDGASSSSSSSSSTDPLTAALRAAFLDDAARAALTPAEIVRRLDEHVVGQAAAKRAVAVALRNRWRRQRLDEAHRREVSPRGLLLVGPTGSGKTEIARRLARLGDAPFVATSATRYTELGYVGADVEDMVKELAEEALRLTRRRLRDALRAGAEARAERAIVRALCGPRAPRATVADFARLYRDGALDDLPVSVEALGGAGGGGGAGEELSGGMAGAGGDEDGEDNDGGGGLFGAPRSSPSRPSGRGTSSSTRRPSSGGGGGPAPPATPGGPTLRVADAREVLLEREVSRRLEASSALVAREALRLASEEGIIFIDEIDKIVEPGAAQRAAAGRGDGWATGGGGGGGGRGGGVSSEGVQRDLLPILEGTVVPTKLGPLDTTHVLFVCAGAFHQARPSDMLGELQGRLPVRVELARMTAADLLRVLTEPKHCLARQHKALLRAEGVDLTLTEGALRAVARCAAEANRLLDDIGARRLSTVLERVLRDISFDAPARVALAREGAAAALALASGAEAAPAAAAAAGQDEPGLEAGPAVLAPGAEAAPANAAAAAGQVEPGSASSAVLVPYVVDEADVERAMAEVLAVPDLSRHML